MRMYVPVMVLAAFLLCVGCLGTPEVMERSEGPLHAHYEYAVGWSPVQGCYERVSGYVYSSGNATIDSAELNLNLVNTATGTIRDSQSVFLGRIGPGETRTFETRLDGECTREYRVDFLFR